MMSIDNMVVVLNKCPHCKKEVEIEIGFENVKVIKAGSYFASRSPKWIRFTKTIGSKNINKVQKSIKKAAEVSLEDVYKDNKDMTKKKVDKIIELLKRRGDAFEPKKGFVSWI